MTQEITKDQKLLTINELHILNQLFIINRDIQQILNSTLEKNFKKKKEKSVHSRPLAIPIANRTREKTYTVTIGIVTSRNRDNLSSFAPRPIKSSSRTRFPVEEEESLCAIEKQREGMTRISSRVVEHGSTVFHFFTAFD